MMRLRRLASATLSFALTFAVVQAGCGTDAVGVDECRDIENARCEAGAHCGLVDDVEACKRFYRDQCLHGLTHSRPGAPQVTACTQTILDAGECAQQGVTSIAECTALTGRLTVHTAVCDVVLKPQGIQSCEFLAAQPVVAPDAASPPPEASLPDGTASD